MQLLNFPLESISEELPAIQLDNGEWLFSAQETCVFGELASRVNAAKWVRNNIPPKWIVELKTKEGNGRPGLYLTKPGFYYAICQGKSENAIKFRDEVFEVILPKIDASGGYIMPNATSEQLEALQEEIIVLRNRCNDYEYRQMLFRELPLVRYLKGITYRLTIKEANHLAQVIMEGKHGVYELDWQRLTWKQLNDIWHRHEDKEVYRKYLNMFHEHGIKPLSK